MKMKRSIGVTVIGWYFIVQGWITLGQISNFGNFALVLVVLFICIGIGLLKLFNTARIAAILLFFILSCYSLFLTISLSGQYSIHQYPESMIVGKAIAMLIFSTLLLIIFLFFFTRPNIKNQFKEKSSSKNKNNESGNSC